MSTNNLQSPIEQKKPGQRMSTADLLPVSKGPASTDVESNENELPALDEREVAELTLSQNVETIGCDLGPAHAISNGRPSTPVSQPDKSNQRSREELEALNGQFVDEKKRSHQLAEQLKQAQETADLLRQELKEKAAQLQSLNSSFIAERTALIQHQKSTEHLQHMCKDLIHERDRAAAKVRDLQVKVDDLEKLARGLGAGLGISVIAHMLRK